MIRERKDRNGLQVQVYAGRDPLSGRKRWVSRQVPGSSRPAMRKAKQVEAELLAEVAAGRHQRAAMPLAQLLDEWLGWRESNGKPISPATLHNYRLTIQTKVKPGLGHLPVTKLDARVLDRFYVVTVMNSASGQAPALQRQIAELAVQDGRHHWHGRQPKRVSS